MIAARLGPLFICGQVQGVPLGPRTLPCRSPVGPPPNHPAVLGLAVPGHAATQGFRPHGIAEPMPSGTLYAFFIQRAHPFDIQMTGPGAAGFLSTRPAGTLRPTISSASSRARFSAVFAVRRSFGPAHDGLRCRVVS